MPKKHKGKKKSKNNFAKILVLVFIILLLPIIFWASQYPQLIFSLGKTTYKLSTLGNTYGSIEPIIRYPSHDPPPENHPDINLDVRGSIPATGEKYPINIDGPTDPKAPQIRTILSQIPRIVSLYKINSWDWNTNKKGPLMPLPDDPEASSRRIQQVGFATIPGEEIFVPESGYIIGENYQVMVIFADENSITIKYGREDDIGIKFGYAIQIDGIEVYPSLLSLYEELNSSGRNQLPALSGGQAMGVAKGNEIRVVIRDTGAFLDPRSKKDWWAAVDYPYPHNLSASPTEIPRITATIPISTTRSPQPTTYYPPPTSYIPTPTNFIPLPTTHFPRPTFIPAQTPIPSETPTPAPTPIIDIGKTIKTAKSFWSIILNRLTNLSKIILP